MSLRFIIGRAGTGKTRRCLSEIAEKLKDNPQTHLIYLVPEQATFHTEKELLKRCAAEGIMHAQVLSFQRLAWRVLQETGGGIYPVLNEVGKTMILRRILIKNSKDIRAFARVIDKPGFLENLGRCVTEIKTYNVTPKMLESCLEQLAEGGEPHDIRAKLEDLVLIYREFEDYLAGQYLDSDDFLDKLAENIFRAPFLEKAHIWLDGFYGFTPQEYAVIRELLLKASKLHLTLCLDSGHLNKKLVETDLFYPPWETYQKMMRIAQEIKCPLEETLVLDFGEKHRFSRGKELAFLERSFFENKPVYQKEVSAIRLATAANRRAELEAVAREMIALCREKGYCFQDMAVLIRDFESYENLLETVFTDYGIPYFMDKKRPLKHHPLVDLLRGALEVLEKGWNYEPLFRYLKTDLASLSRQEVDLLENYCLSHGIWGRRWTDGKPWTYLKRYSLGEDRDEGEYTEVEESELKRINRARQKAVKGLYKLEQNIRKAKTAREYTVFVYELLEELAVARKLEYWSSKAEKEGQLEEAQVHSQVWHKVIELQDQMVEVLGEQEMKLNEFSQLLNSALDCIELGLIPPGLDQVLVGSPDRSRNPDMKAVFVLGVNEGVWPTRVSQQGLLSDEEKKVLARMKIELSPAGDKRLFYEQFLVYLTLTRASEFLWMSYTQADEEGRALSPSYIINHVEKLFLADPEKRLLKFYALEPVGNDEDFITHPLPGLGLLAKGLRQAVDGKPVNPVWWAVYNWYLGQEEWQKSLRRVVTGLFASNREENLSTKQVRQLYGSRLLTSVSRLEKFRACPFSHFLNYGLKLKEREEYRLKAPELGQFFHAALENVCRTVWAKDLSLADMTNEQAGALVEEAVDKLIPKLQNELLLSTSRYRYLTRKFKRTVLRAVRVLREHERRGTFRPLGLEISFGAEGKLPGLELKLADGSSLLLQGRIDRIDGARSEEGYYIRVIDYKSGTPSLSLPEIYYGLKLQLMAYLDVVLTHAPRLIDQEARPGGVFYFKIQDPFVFAQGPQEPEEIERKIMRELKLKGYLIKDVEAVRLMDRDISGASDLVPAAVGARGEFYKNVGTHLTLEEFSGLRVHVEKVLKEIGQGIMDGNVAIRPYRYKGKSPCSYCLYNSICRFDASQPGQHYHSFPAIERDEVWHEIGGRKEVSYE